MISFSIYFASVATCLLFVTTIWLLVRPPRSRLDSNGKAHCHWCSGPLEPTTGRRAMLWCPTCHVMHRKERSR